MSVELADFNTLYKCLPFWLRKNERALRGIFTIAHHYPAILEPRHLNAFATTAKTAFYKPDACILGCTVRHIILIFH